MFEIRAERGGVQIHNIDHILLRNACISFLLFNLLADDNVGQHVPFFVPHLNEHSNTLATLVGTLFTRFNNTEKFLLGLLLRCNVHYLEADEQICSVAHLLTSIGRVAFMRRNGPNPRLAIACYLKIEVVYFLRIVSKDFERCRGERIGKLREKRFIDHIPDHRSVHAIAVGRNPRQESNNANYGC